MAQLQQVEPVEPRTASPRKRKLSDFNYRDPSFNNHAPEFLAYMEHASAEEREAVLLAAIDAADAQVAAGKTTRMTSAELMAKIDAKLGVPFNPRQ